MDENLFYKGVDKTSIEPSRLSQSYPSKGTAIEAPDLDDQVVKSASTSDNPPYLFDSGASLLKLTETHNVAIFIFKKYFYYLTHSR